MTPSYYGFNKVDADTCDHDFEYRASVCSTPGYISSENPDFKLCKICGYQVREAKK